MLVPVMHIREVCMRMGDGQVHMRMGMGFIAIEWEIVLVLVMFVVAMAMRVIERLVRMLMLMSFTHVQPNAQRHHGGGDPERHGRPLGPDKQR